MSDPHHTQAGTIAGASRREAAVALAGALAELGIQTLTLDAQRLESRTTDLPGLLADARHGAVLRILDMGDATIAGGTIEWRAHDAGLAEALSAISRGR